VRRDGQERDVTLALAPVPTADLARQRLGIVVGDMDPTLARGLVVREVVPDGPAAAVGVRAGDVILRLTADPRRAIVNLDDLLLFLEAVQSGDSIDVQVLRTLSDGRRATLTGVIRAR
jgi:S1-C subfamily serine protease